MKAGRKSKFEEMQIASRYAELSVPYFKELKAFLEGDEKADKKFAIEQLTKAYAKMIPQDVTTGGMPIITIAPEVAAKYDITSSPTDDSEGQAQIPSN